ncbi:cell surface glycoprotein [Natrinema sp. J7-2]|uniref:cell surface glycoprotein n=1 Tax=Natrinema sp. (strain J7-2) TaxID=406552 RepID=UPI00026D4609|nr:cell surface glycoprotein [Natrinema sp. J7-2]AFO56218.1 cell surface glycoprotein [Natrinema sp. J7-2]
MNRRTLLLGSGVAVSTVLAGCSSDDSADEGNGGNGTDTSDGSAGSDVDTLRSIGETIDRDDPLFDPEAERYEGSGRKSVTDLSLDSGLTTLAFDHDGTSDFVVLLGGDDEAVLVNETGAVDGATAIATSAGDYVLDVAADGDWTLHVGQPRAPDAAIHTPPAEASDTGPAVVGPVAIEDTATVSGEHAGESNFIVMAYTEADSGQFAGEEVFNEIGTVESETTVDHPGTVWIDVQADGDWSLEVE